MNMRNHLNMNKLPKQVEVETSVQVDKKASDDTKEVEVAPRQEPAIVQEEATASIFLQRSGSGR